MRSGTDRAITNRDELIARVGDMVDAGLVSWNGERRSKAETQARPLGETTVADLLLEDRE